MTPVQQMEAMELIFSKVESKELEIKKYYKEAAFCSLMVVDKDVYKFVEDVSLLRVVHNAARYTEIKNSMRQPVELVVTSNGIKIHILKNISNTPSVVYVF